MTRVSECVCVGKAAIPFPPPKKKGFSTNSHYFLLLKDCYQSSVFKFQKCHELLQILQRVGFLNKIINL